MVVLWYLYLSCLTDLCAFDLLLIIYWYHCIFHFLIIFFFFNDTATTEIYTTDTLFPYTTLFRSIADRPDRQLRCQWSVLRDSLGATALHGSEIATRSEEHTSELQSLMRISYAVFCLKKKNKIK